ncbi:dual specificity protein phosphatase family protein [Moraxellaceae bacterium AER2_44_116]|nr:dual specificity protein phosphatase family protein [Moraxellaceae bacterium]TQC99913.1 dual specificity protein phosphatase family protein [Moraxellaceae bacterium AER2_44_116]
MKTTAIIPLISIGGLPTEAEINTLFLRGVRSLVNVSGVKLSDVYPEQRWDCWSLNEYFFSDIFSSALDIAAIEDMAHQSSFFEETANPEHRQQFLQSVQALSHILLNHESVHVFCHHGVGRSPAVTLAAICQVWSLSLPEAISLVQKLRPQCRITSMSIAASRWIQQQRLTL